MNTGATIDCGRALARNGAVTMDTNAVSINTGSCGGGGTSVTPEPGTVTMAGIGLGLAMIGCWRKSRKQVLKAALTV